MCLLLLIVTFIFSLCSSIGSFRKGCGLLNYESYESILKLPLNLGYSVSGIYNNNLYIIGGLVNEYKNKLNGYNLNIYKLNNIDETYIGYDTSQTITNNNINNNWEILPLNIPNNMDSLWFKTNCVGFCIENIIKNGFFCKKGNCYTQIDNLLYIYNPEIYYQQINAIKGAIMNILLIYDMENERFLNTTEYNHYTPHQYSFFPPSPQVNDYVLGGGCIVNNDTHLFMLDSLWNGDDLQENIFQIYDTVNNIWYDNTQTNKPIYKRSKQTCIIHGNGRYIYVFGGVSGDIGERVAQTANYDDEYWMYSVKETEVYDTLIDINKIIYILINIYFIFSFY